MLASLSEFLAIYTSIIRNESNKVLRLGWYSHNHSHIICHIVADIIRDSPDTLRRSGAIYYRKEMMLSEIDSPIFMRLQLWQQSIIKIWIVDSQRNILL